MKKLLLCAKEKEYLKSYYEQLERFFGKYLEISARSYSEEVKEQYGSIPSPDDKADIVVITSPYAMSYARKYIKDDSKIINLKFIYNKDIINRLKNLPVDTNALIHCKYVSDSQLTAEALYDANLKNLNLYVNYTGNKNLIGKNIDVVLVDRDKSHLNENEEKIIVLGEELISVHTLLEIKSLSGIYSEELDKEIEIYTSSFSAKDTISYSLGLSSVINMQFQLFSEYLDQGLLIIDSEGKVLNHNKLFLNLFFLENNILGKNVDELEDFAHFIKPILHKEAFSNIYFEYKGKQYLITKNQTKNVIPSIAASIIMAKDVTEIMRIETSMYKQLSKKGHVAKYMFEDIIGESTVMTTCKERAKKIATIDKPTLLIGESGTGKELFAQSIHNASPRCKYPFVAVNCAAIPENLLESELFGYEDGAFTGAKKGGKIGLFQLAHKGTLFLDEIGDISLSTQVKLLRAIETKEIMKIGADQITKIDVRIIAATNKSLEKSIEDNTFRLDLYYRLNTLMLNIPPLRERGEDVIKLANYYLALETNRNIHLSPFICDYFKTRTWKGNVRQLKNAIEYAANIAEDEIRIEHLPDYLQEKMFVHQTTTHNNDSTFDKVIPTPNNEKSISMKAFGLHNETQVQAALSIMDMLKKSSMGRRQIKEKLKAGGINISEYSLRNIIVSLSDSKLVHIGCGRAGCRLTDKGIDFIYNHNLAQNLLNI